MTPPAPFVVLITGSRTWHRPRVIQDAIRRVLREAPMERPLKFRHGACKKGADAIADVFLRYLGADVDRMPAQWRRFGQGAGQIRNAAMVEKGADLCLAFIDPCADRACTRPGPHGSHGAAHTAELADAAGIEVRRYEGTEVAA